ncbi:MAG: hypothetical protein F2545_01610, partial [Actinobacteria bacterium]|nr:hypothetical protein [Actinomycetota bacterium]
MEAIKTSVQGLKSALRRLVSLGAATLLLTSTFVISIDGIVGVRIASASTQAGMRDTTFPTSLPDRETRGLVVASTGEIFVARNVGFVRYSSSGTPTTILSSGAFDAVALQNIGGTEYVIVGGPGTSPTAQLMRYTLAGVRDTTFGSGQPNAHRALSVSPTTNKIFAGVATSNALVRYSDNGVSEASVAPGGVINAVKVYSAGGTEYVLVGGAFGMKRYVAGTLVDSGFAANPGATVNAIEVQPDGKILVGGTFGLRRYLAIGEIDSEFASVSGTVTAVAVQSDRKILAGIGNLRRYSSTGVAETVFNNNAALDSNFGVSRNSIAFQSDGRIIVGGDANPAHRYLRRYSAVYAAPSTPPAPTAVAQDMQASVSVTAGSGVVPTSYIVTTVQDSSKTCIVTGASGSCVVTGLTNGVAYTFTSTAVNGDVSSSASVASNAVTPFAIPPVISTAVLGASGTTLTLTYNEAVAATTAIPSNFTVTVNGTPIGVTNVSASGTDANVVLTLD